MKKPVAKAEPVSQPPKITPVAQPKKKGWFDDEDIVAPVKQSKAPAKKVNLLDDEEGDFMVKPVSKPQGKSKNIFGDEDEEEFSMPSAKASKPSGKNKKKLF